MTIGNPVFSSNNTLSNDILLCLKTLLSITAGTQPMDREFGISADITSKPTSVAQNLYSLEVIEKVAKYEPRVSVTSVDFEINDGQMIPHIHLQSVEEEDNE